MIVSKSISICDVCFFSFFAFFTLVDKGKPKTSPRVPSTQVPAAPVDTQAVELAQCKVVCEEQKGIVQQLKSLLTCSNQKFEALTVVIQHVINEVRFALFLHSK